MQINLKEVEGWMSRLENGRSSYEQKWNHLKRVIKVEKDLYDLGVTVQEIEHGKK